MWDLYTNWDQLEGSLLKLTDPMIVFLYGKHLGEVQLQHDGLKLDRENISYTMSENLFGLGNAKPYIERQFSCKVHLN
jgi:hypothetical protein